MQECIPYKFRWYHLFVIPSSIYKTVCMSYDKTNLFITSFARLIIYCILFYYIKTSTQSSPEQQEQPDNNNWYFILSWIFISIILINITVVLLVIFKKNYVPKEINQT